MISIWLKVAALVAISLVASASTSSGANAEHIERERVARVEYLIELLASKNAAPKVVGDARAGDDQTITFAKNYDRSAQTIVYLAAMQLLAEDEGAIDILLAHKDDDRYSLSINSYKDYNLSVSRVCHWIAERKLLCYEPELHVFTRSQFRIYPDLDPFGGSSSSWVAWWKENGSRGLAELQLEAIDTEIKFMEEVDCKTALPLHADAPRLPVEEFDRLRNENLKTLKAIRNYISGSGAPYRPKALETHHRYIFGLPWTGRRHNK